MKKFETNNAETICLELIIGEKKRCILFASNYITLNKILGKYDNILLAGDLNTDERKAGSDS